MPRQLVFTSVPAGLTPGRSGYCTVARSAGIGERLAREIERLSAHEPGEGECYAFNILRTSGETVALLTRFGDAGADYSGRASTIAHHLVFDTAEIPGLPPPADIARRFDGWTTRWEGPPRTLPDDLATAFPGRPAALPAETWKRLAGDAGKAALFCDDAGRPKAGLFPAPGDKDTLALIAEAALLLEDKGWSAPFSTRTREPDTWAVWRASPSVIAAALPDPGLARRATLARTGLTAAVRPTPGTSTVRGARRAHGAVFTTPEKKPGLPPAVLVAAGAIALGAVGLIVFLLGGKSPATAPDAPPANDAPSIPTTPAVVHPLAKAAFDALAREDISGAARAWIALVATSPADAEKHRALILPPVREKLLPSGLAPLRKKYAAATAPLSAAEAAGIGASIAELRELAAKTDISLTSGAGAAFTEIETGLSVMRRADEAVPVCTLAAPSWTEENATEIAVTKFADLGEVPALTEFLSQKHAALRVVVSGYQGFGLPRTPGFTVEVPAKNFVPGRILSVVHPEYKQLLEFSVDERKRVKLLRRAILSAPAGIGLLNSETTSLSVTLTAPDTGENHTLILLGSAPTTGGLGLPKSMLTSTGGTVTPAPWVAGLLRRIHASTRPSLLPEGATGDARNPAGLETSKAVIEQALRTRIAAASLSPAQKTEAARLNSLLQTMPANAVEAGAPWSIITYLTSARGGVPVPLIRFDP